MRRSPQSRRNNARPSNLRQQHLASTDRLVAWRACCITPSARSTSMHWWLLPSVQLIAYPGSSDQKGILMYRFNKRRRAGVSLDLGTFKRPKAWNQPASPHDKGFWANRLNWYQYTEPQQVSTAELAEALPGNWHSDAWRRSISIRLG